MLLPSCHVPPKIHYKDAIMMVSQISSITVVYSTVYSRRSSKKTSKLRVAGFFEVNSPVTGKFRAQRSSYSANVSIWWRHRGNQIIIISEMRLKISSPNGGQFVEVEVNMLCCQWGNMMTSSNGNIFRVTGHLCGEFTGPRRIPSTKATDAELWCFL